MKKFFVCLIVILIFILINYNRPHSLNSELKFSMSCEQDVICKNEEVSVILSAKADSATNISTFKVTLCFDKTILSFKDATSISPINESEFKTNSSDSSVDVIFLTENEGINIDKGQKICLAEFSFQANKTTSCNETLISTTIDGIGNYDEQYITASQPEDVSLKVKDAPKFDCKLKSLSTPYGQITPDFDKDLYDYEVNVSSDTGEITFDAVPINYDAIVKTSRRKLKKPGEETIIKITVSSEDKKSKMVYRIKVKREPKENVASLNKPNKENSNSKNTNSKKSKTSTKTSTTKNTKNRSSETPLGVLGDDTDFKTIVLRENGFSFIIFCIIVFSVVATLFLIWRHRKQSDKLNIEQKNN